MITKVIEFAQEIQTKLENGMGLREISRWSFAERENGRDIPYLRIAQTETDEAITFLEASPTKKQPSWLQFFAEVAPGCVALPRFVLRVTSERVQFIERTGKKETCNLI